ncbi:MAG TPA: endolytic transglycosylase MltG [Gammaproteobacteria bacterium]|nr:endolytic transglycosylase MltG [Gammaproteobacteria bacterium]
MGIKGKTGRLFLVALLLAGAAAAGWVVDFNRFQQTPLRVAEQGLPLTLTPGTTLGTVARRLVRAGVLERPAYLVLLARWRGDAARIQSGEYRLRTGMKPGELLDMLVSGKVVQHSFTIVEGWTFRDLLQALREQDTIKPTLTESSPGQIMAALGAPGQHPEGRFLPDTYHFPRGTTDVAFLRRAYEAMNATLAELWPKRDPGLPYDAPYQALIMASIIEKETALAGERAAIAGVFVRRLQKGMLLQTDPTVIYGMGAAFDGNIRRRDLTRETPYNTYVRRGLPPTPIALPGREALYAALHPAPGDALYFVSRGDGSHQFSATLVEHNKAVRRYQLGRR